MPSARTKDMTTPAPRCTGVAIILSPTRPTATRRNSSSPVGETTLRVMLALMRVRAGIDEPSSRSSNGISSNSAVRAADTGYPGTPITALPDARPNATGWPGRTAMPCTCSVPSDSMTEAV